MVPIVAWNRPCYQGPVTTKNPQKYEPIVLTKEQVRELLAEGRLGRAELERRIAKMHENNISFEQRFSKAK